MTKKSTLRGLYDTFFAKTWPMWVGGILLAVLNILLFVIKYPWGASGGYVNIGQNLYKVLGIWGSGAVKSISLHTTAMLCIMIVVGAFISALLSKEFGIRFSPIGELIKGFIGGALMGIGATVGIGCTIGGFYSGWSALSGGALMIALGFLIGTFVALKYLLWEMEAFPKISSGKTPTLLSGTAKYSGWQRWLGWIVIVVVFIIAFRYTSAGNKILGWHIIIGLLLGMILQRSRFCIVRAFREPFMTGESAAPVGVMASLVIAILGFTVIKYFGIGAANPVAARVIEMKSVYSNFWLRAPIGGFIFGLGMTIAGGCAVGTLWRAGEGHVKLWMSAIGFIIMAPISKLYIVPAIVKLLPHSLRYKLFLPDIFGYAGAVALILIIILLWYIFVKWNEKTGKFSAL